MLKQAHPFYGFERCAFFMGEIACADVSIYIALSKTKAFLGYF